jgi:hypothetical protein
MATALAGGSEVQASCWKRGQVRPLWPTRPLVKRKICGVASINPYFQLYKHKVLMFFFTCCRMRFYVTLWTVFFCFLSYEIRENITKQRFSSLN